MATKETWSPKDPGDKKWYWFNFAPLLPTGVTVTSCVTEIDANQHEFADPYVDLEKIDDAIIDDTWVGFLCIGGVPPASGTAGTKYNVHFHATASNGEERDVDKTLQVKERIIS